MSVFRATKVASCFTNILQALDAERLTLGPGQLLRQQLGSEREHLNLKLCTVLAVEAVRLDQSVLLVVQTFLARLDRLMEKGREFRDQ